MRMGKLWFLMLIGLILLSNFVKSEETILGEVIEEEEDGEDCKMNSMCASCDDDRGVCSTDALPCRFSYYYKQDWKQCVLRIKQVDFCTRYKNWYLDDGVCSRCQKSHTLLKNEGQGVYTCEKRGNLKIYDCVEGCDYCWTKKSGEGWHQKGCYGCSSGYSGQTWIEDEVVASCELTTSECSDKCSNCTKSAANTVICMACKDQYIIDFKNRWNCTKINDEDFKENMNCYMSTDWEKAKDKEDCLECWWGYVWDDGRCAETNYSFLTLGFKSLILIALTLIFVFYI